MEKDIVPELLENINNDLDEKMMNSDKLKKAFKNLKDKNATYRDANDFAIESGEILADVFNKNITADKLPDGKMYYNIADHVISPAMKKNHEIISGYVSDVQTSLNHAAGLKIKGQKADLNKDRIDGIINRLSNEENFDDVKWLLDEPMINFSQSIVDDTIKKNAAFHDKAGLRPKITRKVSGHACDWCQNLAGTYNYRDAPDDIYRRHQRCRCTVDYDPGDGKKQDVWSKTWTDPDRNVKIEARKNIGLANKPKRFDLLPLTDQNLNDKVRMQKMINRSKKIVGEYKEKTGIDVVELWKNGAFSDKNNSYNDEKAKFMEYLLKKTGYSQKPVKLKDTKNLQALFRSVSDFEDGSITGDDLVNAFKNGKNYISGSSKSAHGRGSYFFLDKIKADGRKGNALIEAFITNNAKFIDEDLIYKTRVAFNENRDQFGEDAIFYDFILQKNSLMDKQIDIFTILSGYDGIISKGIAIVLNRASVGVL